MGHYYLQKTLTVIGALVALAAICVSLYFLTTTFFAWWHGDTDVVQEQQSAVPETTTGPTGYVYYIDRSSEINEDGSYFSDLYAMNVATGEERQVTYYGGVYHAAIVNDDQVAVVVATSTVAGDYAEQIVMYEYSTDKVTEMVTIEEVNISNLTFNDTGEYFAYTVSPRDGGESYTEVRSPDFELVTTIPGVAAAAWSNERRLAFVDEGLVKLYDVLADVSLTFYRTEFDPELTVISDFYTPTGDIVTSVPERRLLIANRMENQVMETNWWVILEDQDDISPRFSPDGAYVATARASYADSAEIDGGFTVTDTEVVVIDYATSEVVAQYPIDPFTVVGGGLVGFEDFMVGEAYLPAE